MGALQIPDMIYDMIWYVGFNSGHVLWTNFDLHQSKSAHHGKTTLTRFNGVASGAFADKVALTGFDCVYVCCSHSSWTTSFTQFIPLEFYTVMMLLTLLVFHHSSLFRSRLNNLPFLQILPTAAFLFFFQDWLHGFPGLFADTSGHIHFLLFIFFLFSTFSCWFPCGRLSWLMSAFERTLK